MLVDDGTAVYIWASTELQQEMLQGWGRAGIDEKL
jgi:hypothetical protein